MTQATATRAPRTRSKRARPRPDAWAWTGIVIVVLGLFLALFGPYLAPYNVGQIVGTVFNPPSEASPLGTDVLGRDILTRVLYGARLTVGVALAATVTGFLIGMAVGFSAAEIRGR